MAPSIPSRQPPFSVSTACATTSYSANGSAPITFTVSFDELALTYFVNGNTNTLPMYIWSMLRQGIEALRLR